MTNKKRFLNQDYMKYIIYLLTIMIFLGGSSISYASESDTSPPIVNILSPEDGTSVNKISQIQGSAEDNLSGIFKVELRITDGNLYLFEEQSGLGWTDSESWVTATGTESWNLNTFGVSWSQGQVYTITGRVTDNAGNVSTSSISIFFTEGDLATTEISLYLEDYTIPINSTIDVVGKISSISKPNLYLGGLSIMLRVEDPYGNNELYFTTTDDYLGHFLFEGISGFSDSGDYVMRAYFTGNSIFYQSDSPLISLVVGSVGSVGYAILIEGKIPNEEGVESHNKTANRVYRSLKERNFRDDDIYYLNFDDTQVGVDVVPSKNAVKNAIETWAMNKMNSDPSPLWIIMIGHTSDEAFYIDSETIQSNDIDEWIDNLEANLVESALAQKRIIAIGTSYSGSFIPEISGSGRIIVTSSAANEPAYKGTLEPDGIRSGDYFLEDFFRELKQGKSLKSSFYSATERTEIITRRDTFLQNERKYPYFDNAVQHPLLDDDGDGKGSNFLYGGGEGDGYESLVYLGIGSYSPDSPNNPAGILEVTETIYIDQTSNSSQLWVKSNNDSKVSSIWMEIRSPSVSLFEQISTSQLELELPKNHMSYSSPESLWQTTSDYFIENGMYEIYYYVVDVDTEEISPMMRSILFKNKVNNNDPEQFNLIEPPNSAEVLTILILKWECSVDPDNDPVTYTVEISEDSDFSNIVYRAERITHEYHNISFEASLSDSTNYYWRVIAIDPYGAHTYSEIRTFYTNNVNYIPGFLNGIVIDSNGNPVEEAVISLLGTFDSTVSDADGFFNFFGWSGDYTLTINAAGYKPFIKEIDIPSGGEIMIECQLEANSFHTRAEPSSGIYSSPQEVTLTCADGFGPVNCNTIYYTIDGSEPTTSSNQYSTPILIDSDTVLKFYGDYIDKIEPTRTESYVIDSEGPIITINSPENGWSGNSLLFINGTAYDESHEVEYIKLEIANSSRTLFLNQNQWLVEDQTWITPLGKEEWSFDTKYVNWLFGGNDSYTIYVEATDTLGNTSIASSSFVRTDIGQKEASNISSAITKDSIVLGENVTLEGQISPAPTEGGAFVMVTLFSPSDDPEDNISKSVVANEEGIFSYPLSCEDLNQSGDWSARVSWIGDSELEGDYSDDYTIFTVSKAKSLIRVDVPKQVIKYGESAAIVGKFTPNPDCSRRDLSEIAIDLEFIPPLGSFKEPFTKTIMTGDPFGHFQFIGGPTQGVFDHLGEWMVLISFNGNEAFNSINLEPIYINVVETAGYAIIVEGKTSNEEGLESHHKTTKFVYKTLRERGLQPNDIKYFTYFGSEEIKVNNNEEYTHVSGPPIKTNIQNAVTVWAKDNMDPAYNNPSTDETFEHTGKPANLYIIMVDHGNESIFYVDPSAYDPENQIITPTDLAGWLNSLQTDLSSEAADQDIIVLLGFCHSGSFIQDISGPNRVIITSAASDEASYRGPSDGDLDSKGNPLRDGEYFITEFFKKVEIGKSVKESFESAVALTEIFTSSGLGDANSTNSLYSDSATQHPLLEDDNVAPFGSNDISETNFDGQYSENLFIGVSPLSTNAIDDVNILKVTETIFLKDEVHAELWAKVSHKGFRSLWIEIKGPNYNISGGDTYQAAMELPPVLWDNYNYSEDRYEWSIDTFSDPGIYQILYFVRDDTTENLAPLVDSIVYKEKPGNNPPKDFNLLDPADEEVVTTILPLVWEKSFDQDTQPDPLTYTVIISRDIEFNSFDIKKEGLTDEFLFIDLEDGLINGFTYYWQVIAIDQYGSQTFSSEVRSFTTNNTNDVIGFINLRVSDDFDQGIEDATIEFVNPDTQKVVTFFEHTHATGSGIIPINSGNWQVTATAPGYDSQTKTIYIPPDDYIDLNFTINPAEDDGDNVSLPWLLLLLGDD
ncbi:carboxypeptidase regulatory-like domain-containing protein [Thermodesulfobacteriota bacterium]